MKDVIDETPEVEPTPRDWRSFWSLVAMQVQNAFNDNMAKFILVPLGAWLVVQGQGFKGVEHALSALLVLPFILFAPTSGWLADRYPKSAIIRGAAWLQLVVLGLMAAALFAKNLPLAMAAFFLLALQSTLLSPAKMGVVKELLGTRKLAYASGMMEATVILAILGGMIFGGVWFDRLLKGSGDGWSAALVPVLCLWAGGLIAIMLAYRIQATRAMTTERFSAAVAFRHFSDLRDVWRQRRLRQVVLGVAFFWGFAGFMSLVVVQIAKELHHGRVGTGTTNSGLMAAASVGIALGSVIAGRLSRRGIELGLAPLGALIMSAAVLSLALTAPASMVQYALLLTAGAGAAIFLVPLNACVLDWSGEAERGKVVSVSNLMNNTFGIAAVALQFAMGLAGLATRWQFLIFGLLTVAVSGYVIRRLALELARLVVHGLVHTLYRVRALDAERMPAAGAVMLVPNHVSFIDSLLVSAASPRPVRFLIDERFYHRWWVRWVARLAGSVPIARDNLRTAIGQVSAALSAGEVVCVFAEGRLTRTGFMSELRRGCELMARTSGAVVMPVYIDGAWGSVFSFERGRFLGKRPYRIPSRITVAVQPPVAPGDAQVGGLRAALLDGAAAALEARAEDVRLLERRIFDGGEPEVLRGIDMEQRRRLCLHLLQLASVAGWSRQARLWLCPEVDVAVQQLVHGFARGFGGRVEHGLPAGDGERSEVIGGAAMRGRLVGSGGVVFFDIDAGAGPDPALGGGIVHCPCWVVGGRMVAMSTPAPPPAVGETVGQPGSREGSAGRLLPGFVVSVDGEALLVGGPSLEAAVRLPAGTRVDAEGFVFFAGSAGTAASVELAKRGCS
jgi:acyl-[acyl-carrier-protein]-phospholipid O-acyltransferase/long-chain-fatty-acid--[acyl-carrier-protein] ligase